jgi:hypothetical protein
MSRSKREASNDAPKVATFDRSAPTEDQIVIAEQIIEAVMVRTEIAPDPLELLADLRLAIDTFDLDRASGPKSPWRHVTKQHQSLQAAAKRLVFAIRDERNALAVDELTKQLGPEFEKLDGLQPTEALVVTLKLPIIIAYQPPQNSWPKGDEAGRGTVEHLTRVVMPFLFRKHFGYSATSSLGTLVEPDSAFIRFVLASFKAFHVTKTGGKAYSAFTIATYMKQHQTGGRKRPEQRPTDKAGHNFSIHPTEDS